MRQTYYNNNVIDVGAEENAVNGFVAKVFGWMFIGLLITCLSTVAIIVGINISESFSNFIFRLSNMAFILFIVEMFIVGMISARVAKMNPANAIMLYIIYAVINGLTVGLFSAIYAQRMGNGLNTLGMAVGVTGLAFGIMALYGMVTKSDLTKVGKLLMMGLVGVLILSVVNIFMKSTAMDYFICVAGLFVFLGLVAFDTRKIKSFYTQIAESSNVDSDGSAYMTAGLDRQGLASNLAIVGALILYLDFVNIFMFVLRLLTGGSRR